MKHNPFGFVSPIVLSNNIFGTAYRNRQAFSHRTLGTELHLVQDIYCIAYAHPAPPLISDSDRMLRREHDLVFHIADKLEHQSQADGP